ncbi:MAG: hypothetical protein ACHP65_09645 [Legionellales bacterium]
MLRKHLKITASALTKQPQQAYATAPKTGFFKPNPYYAIAPEDGPLPIKSTQGPPFAKDHKIKLTKVPLPKLHLPKGKVKYIGNPDDPTYGECFILIEDDRLGQQQGG